VGDGGLEERHGGGCGIEKRRPGGRTREDDVRGRDAGVDGCSEKRLEGTEDEQRPDRGVTVAEVDGANKRRDAGRAVAEEGIGGGGDGEEAGKQRGRVEIQLAVGAADELQETVDDGGGVFIKDL
jgi:hypothetical protein